jgi:hypothetical protein
MDTDRPKPTIEELEQKLDEIKTALNIRTTTTSILNDISDIKNKLGYIEKYSKKGTWVTVATVAVSYVLTGLVLTLTAVTLPRAYSFGWGLVGIGLAGAIYCSYKSSKIKA